MATRSVPCFAAHGGVITAHNLILKVLELQGEQFSIPELESPRQRCFEDFMEVWGRNSDKEQPNQTA